jgi:hypothetical protein
MNNDIYNGTNIVLLKAKFLSDKMVSITKKEKF